PCVLDRVSLILPARERRTELRASHRGDIGIGGHLVDRRRAIRDARIGDRIVAQPGGALIARGDENALALRSRLLEQWMDDAVDERRRRSAKSVADTNGAALIVIHRAGDV